MTLTDPLPPPPAAPLPPASPYPYPPLPPQPPKQKSRALLVILTIMTTVVVMVVLITLLGASANSKKTTATVTTGVPAGQVETPLPTTPTTTAAPTTTALPDHVPTPADFTLEVIELKRSCFGTAGCNITYQIAPTYTGPALNPSKTYKIIYEVVGGESAKSDNFEIRGTKATQGTSDYISTPPNPSLSAHVTRVLG